MRRARTRQTHNMEPGTRDITIYMALLVSFTLSAVNWLVLEHHTPVRLTLGIASTAFAIFDASVVARAIRRRPPKAAAPNETTTPRRPRPHP